MKDAARLAAYFIAIIVGGALVAPILFWSTQAIAAHGVFPFLAKYDFDTFFHRAILIAAVLLLWPLLRASNVRGLADLGLAPNPHWGAMLASESCSRSFRCSFAVLCLLHCMFTHFGTSLSGRALARCFLRRSAFRSSKRRFSAESSGHLTPRRSKGVSVVAASALFAAVHFLKGSEWEPAIVTWTSGFQSIGDAFAGFGDPMMVLGAFATLFLIGCILADARVLTRSLWLPIGLHAGWIFASGTFNWLARGEWLRCHGSARICSLESYLWVWPQ